MKVKKNYLITLWKNCEPDKIDFENFEKISAFIKKYYPLYT